VKKATMQTFFVFSY